MNKNFNKQLREPFLAPPYQKKNKKGLCGAFFLETNKELDHDYHLIKFFFNIGSVVIYE